MSTGHFRHGVASGDPLPDGVVLWTRVSAGADQAVEVSWRLAADHELRHVVASGTTIAEPAHDHTVHVDVRDLEPATTYFYGFECTGDTSPVGRTRTLPVGDVAQVRMAVVSCASFNAGYFNVYARIAELDDIDFVLHLGDYVYETPNELPPGAPQPPEMGRPFEPLCECVTLADYRQRYAQYHVDADLRRLHRRHPIVAILDDHEYADGAWREGSSWHTPEQGPFAARKTAALQARWEWLPCRPPDPDDPERVYQSIALGDLADLFLIDTRTHRDQPVPPPAMDDPGRTALGATQRDWLLDGLGASTARWRILGNASVMGQTWADHLPEAVRAPLALLRLLGDEGVGPDPDQWDGYPAERSALFRRIDERAVENLVVLSGDVHVALAIELHADSFAGREPVGVEFVTASVTSMNLDDKKGWPRRSKASLEIERATVDALPHWKWCELDSNGYMVVDVTPDRLVGEWWFVDTVLEPSAYQELAASWMVVHGDPHAVPVG